ncbi:MAG TPA: alpha/beta hydrolase [Symbiobacteriaceae bacterium]|jgi:pimeloyl-ACP methyl ester carboxylesterase
MRPTALAAASPLYYIESGGGDPVVLLHGLGADNRTWDGVRPSLARSWRVFTPDLPGHGQTSLPGGELTLDLYVTYVARWLDALGTGPVRLAGHSLGGAVALALAARRPDLARSVSAIGPLGLLDDKPPGPVLRTFVLFSVAQTLGMPSPGATRRYLGQGLGVAPSALTPELVARWQETSHTAAAAMIRVNRELRRPDAGLSLQLPRVECPVGLLWGERDPLFPGRAAAASIAGRCRKASTTYMETGNLPMAERPDEFQAWLEAQLHPLRG